MQHNYFIAWSRIIKIGQIDVLFTITRTKMEHRVTYKDSFLHYSIFLKIISIDYPAFLFRPSIDVLKNQTFAVRMPISMTIFK